MFNEPNPKTANMRFIRTGEYEYKTEQITQKDLDKAREHSKKFDWMGLGRSCWECNSAHIHHIDEGNYNCFACGRFYHDGIDITDYTGSKLEKIAKKNLLP